MGKCQANVRMRLDIMALAGLNRHRSKVIEKKRKGPTTCFCADGKSRRTMKPRQGLCRVL